MHAAFPETYWWAGFYLVRGDELQLGPFQGPVACMTIRRGKGVCGTAWERNETLVVADVDQFPGHIACSSESRSEIVVPIRGDGGEVVAEIDVDSRELAAFDEVDRLYLENISKILSAELAF
ncbi:GAF domain-containing protein [Prevotella sp. KH2C16]|uniref:GAF domain-containing protein n=1 Tax=Prevotella sp. KH2C16 TaxID=1855325 RepID=UPI00350F153A